MNTLEIFRERKTITILQDELWSENEQATAATEKNLKRMQLYRIYRTKKSCGASAQ